MVTCRVFGARMGPIMDLLLQLARIRHTDTPRCTMMILLTPSTCYKIYFSVPGSDRPGEILRTGDKLLPEDNMATMVDLGRGLDQDPIF